MNNTGEAQLIDRRPGTVVTSLINGRTIRFFVANEQDEIQKHHHAGSFYEVEELGIMRAHWRCEGIFVDIGANVGNHTVYVSKFFDASRLVVFEPNPAAIRILRVNLALNQCTNVDLRYLGTALASGTSLMRLVEVDPHNLGGASFVPDAQGEVRSIPGDALLLNENVSFLKIDVEGMEMDILRGLERTVRNWRPSIFIEVWSQNSEGFFQWCEGIGYQIVDQYQRYRDSRNYMAISK
jgi:FkbM family methyltransferase